MSFVAAAIAGSAALGLWGASKQAGAAKEAAATQTEGANYAADLAYQAQQQALAEQQRQFNIAQGNLAPWLAGGQAGLSGLLYGMGLGSLQQTQPYVAPSGGYTPTGYGTNLTGASPAAQQLYGHDANYWGPRIATTGNYSWVPGVDADPSTGKVDQQLRSHYQSMLPNLSQQDQQFMQGIFGQADQYAETIASQIGEGGGAGQMAQWGVVPGAESATGMPTGYGDLMKTFGPEDYVKSPGYEFLVDEGRRAIDMGAAAKGRALSGGTIKEALRYQTGLAAQDYGNAWNRFQSEQDARYNRLANLAGLGQTATSQVNALGQNYASNVGNILTGTAASMGDLATQAANARASGYMGSANAWGNALGGLGNLVMGIPSLYSLSSGKDSPISI